MIDSLPSRRSTAIDALPQAKSSSLLLFIWPRLLQPDWIRLLRLLLELVNIWGEWLRAAQLWIASWNEAPSHAHSTGPNSANYESFRERCGAHLVYNALCDVKHFCIHHWQMLMHNPMHQVDQSAAQYMNCWILLRCSYTGFHIFSW